VRKEVIKWTAKNTEAFFVALGEHGVVRRAAKEVGISAMSVYHRKLRDPDFAKRLEDIVR